MFRTRCWTVLALLLCVSLLVAACAAPETVAPEIPSSPEEPAVEEPTTAPAEEPTAVQPVADEPGEAASPNGGTIVLALAAAPTSLDPADHRSRESETVIRNMYDGLVTRDTRSGVHPELAEETTWLDDTTLEVVLRQGVLFHDGTEMTADDVVRTFERIITEDAIEYPEMHSSPRSGLISPLESVEKTGDYTVVMHFSDAWPPAMQMLVHQQIVSAAYLDAVGTEGLVGSPMGTGPFRFVSVAPGLEEVVMERFDDYYGGAPSLEPTGPACVERVIFRVIPESSTRVAALLAGEVHIIESVPFDLIDDLEANPNVEVYAAPSTQPLWLELNVDRAPFDDVRVRQALNHAVDKDLLIEAVFGGRAEALPGPLSPYNNFVNESLEPYAYDPDLALSLFAEAGWTDSDDDGYLDRDGQPLAFTIDTLDQHRELAEALASILQDIGIDANVRFWEYGVIQPQLAAGERMAYLDDWGDSAFDPVGHFEAKWHGRVEGEPYGRGNFSGYDNSRVNELIRQGETTVDTSERQALYDEAQELVYEEAPAVFLVLPEVIQAASASVQNWEPASDGRLNMHDVCLAE